MHPDISINSLSFGPAPLDKVADKVARLGAQAITPDIEQVLAFGTTAAALLFRDAGLETAALTHRAFAFATPEDVSVAHERLARTIDIAVEIGARSIVMTTGGRGLLSWADATDRFAEAIAPCTAKALAAGIALGLEPTSHLYAEASIAHRLSDTVRIARKAGISVVVDLFACWFDADIDAAITKAAPLTALVQVSDYIYGDRGLPCRAVPGDGALPLDRLVPEIVGAGYRGYFDLEIVGPRLQVEGDEVGLCRAGHVLGAILGEARAR
jgi:sugar phosphate isomerase/epimerase